MIYFITDGEHTKIGHTTGTVERRLKGLQTGSPRRLRLLGTAPGGVAQERALHARFADRRCVGEWFTVNADDVRAVEGFGTLTPATNRGGRPCRHGDGHPTRLAAWLCSADVTRAALSRECKDVDPSVDVPAPHVSMYAHGKFTPTPKKAGILSAATYRLAERAGRPGDGVSVEELLFPDGLPDDARIVQDESQCPLSGQGSARAADAA